MAHSLLTIAEVDALLNDVVYPEWDALDDEFKQHYIEQASNYVRLNWVYYDSNFDWELAGTWPDHTDEGIAQYSNAVALNYLYPRPEAGSESQAPIKRTKQKVGSLETETEYAQPDSSKNPSQLKPIDDIFIEAGFTRINGPGSLRRV